MDCISFDKDIRRYLEGELDDQELNDFLGHYKTCPQCREELEINYLATEGIRILDTDNADYDLSDAFAANTRKNFNRLRFRKFMMRAAFVADTLVIWAVAAALWAYLASRI